MLKEVGSKTDIKALRERIALKPVPIQNNVNGSLFMWPALVLSHGVKFHTFKMSFESDK